MSAADPGLLNRPAPSYRRAFLVLLVVVCAFFWRELFTGGVLYYRDITYAHMPHVIEMRNLVRAGHWPLWNPWEHFGEPVAVNANYLLFYPTTWLTWILPVFWAFNLHFVLHFLLMAAGVFLLARRLGFQPWVCAFTGAIFAFSGPALSLGSFYNMVAAAAWLPLVVLAADSFARSGTWRSLAVFIAAVGLQVLAGEPLTNLASITLAFAWVMAFPGKWSGRRLRLVGVFAVAMIVAVCIGAVQLIPGTLQLFKTARTNLGAEHSFFWSFHPLKIFEMLVPRALGDNISQFGNPWLYVQGREAFLLSEFLGIVPVSLAAVAAFIRRDRLTRFWAIAALATLLIASGPYLKIGYVFYYAIPVFRVLRYPEKLMVEFAFAVALLAGAAVDELASHRAVRSRALVAVQAFLVLFAGAWTAATAYILLRGPAARPAAERVAGWVFSVPFIEKFGPAFDMDRSTAVTKGGLALVEMIPSRLPYLLLASALVIVLFRLVRRGRGEAGFSFRDEARRGLLVFTAFAAVAYLAVNHYGLNPVAPKHYFTDEPPPAHFLKSAHPPLRVFATPRPVTLQPDMVNSKQLEFLPLLGQFIYTQRMSLLWGQGMVNVEGAFTVDPEQIQDRAYNEYLTFINTVGDLGAIARGLALASTEYALMPPGAKAVYGLEPAGTLSGGAVVSEQIFKVTDSVPRTYLVDARAAEVHAVGPETMLRIGSGGLDVRRQVSLEYAAPPPGQAPAERTLSHLAGEANLLRRDPMRVEIEARAEVPSYLVLTDMYHSGWRATVDGAPAPIIRANEIFRAVPVAQGSHRIVMVYRPLDVISGAIISVLALAVLLWLAFGARARRTLLPETHAGG